MSLAVNSNATLSTDLPDAHAASTQSIASLHGQIQQFKQQLDDWTTCVSAKTTKGQAEIQRLSGELSAAEDRVKRLAAVPARSIDVWA